MRSPKKRQQACVKWEQEQKERRGLRARTLRSQQVLRDESRREWQVIEREVDKAGRRCKLTLS